MEEPTESELSPSIFRRMCKLYQKGFLCDVTLIIGGLKLPCHRVVLVSASDYFKAKLMTDAGHPVGTELKIYGCDGNSVHSLIDFIYSGHLDPHGMDIEKLLLTAHILQLPTAQNICFQYLNKTCSLRNWRKTRKLALRYNNIHQAELSFEFAVNNFPELTKLEEWLSLTSVEVEALLNSSNLNAPSEEFIYKALVKWVEHDPGHRSGDFCKIFGLLNLLDFSYKFIKSEIMTQPAIKANAECLALVVDSLLSDTDAATSEPEEHFVEDSAAGAECCAYHPEEETESYSYEPEQRSVQGSASDTDSELQQIQTYLNNVEYFIVGHNKFHASVHIYDFEIGIWVKLFDLATDVNSLTSLVMGDSIFIFGIDFYQTFYLDNPTLTPRKLLYPTAGSCKDFEVTKWKRSCLVFGRTYAGSVEKFHPQEEIWEQLAPMLERRRHFSLVCYKNNIYVVGGQYKGSWLSSVEYYSPALDIWRACSPMSVARCFVGLGVLDEHIYAVGGQTVDNYTMNLVERYDPKLDAWVSVAPVDSYRENPAVIAMEGRLLVIGGYEQGNRWSCLVEAYDPKTNKWETIDPITEPLIYPKVTLKFKKRVKKRKKNDQANY